MARIKGIYFTLDALFAAILIGMGLVLSSQLFISEVQQPQINYYSQDIVNSLANIYVHEVNDSYIQELIITGEITYPNNTVIEQIGEFYVLNKTELAENLSIIVGEKLIPERYGFQILVNDETVHFVDSPDGDRYDLVSARRLISGIEKFKPLRGATSKVFLEGINSKRFSSYLYFGGFIGQGNITQKISDIPSDADIYNVELELDAAGDFSLYINEDYCDAFTPVSNLTVAERWNITDCKGSFVNGATNLINITFDDFLNESFLAGGFLRVDYDTQELSGYFEGYKIRYDFPGITGIANLYDAFYVPGTVNSMNIYLHFKTNETSYLTIGSRIIHQWNGSDTEQKHNLTDINFSTIDFANLADDYPLFSNNTVPIRFASYEPIVKKISSGNADVILITDFSGSMKKSVTDWSQGTGTSDCEDLYTYDNARKSHLARCVDNELVSTVMNGSGSRVWPVFMHSNDDCADNTYDNPLDEVAVKNYIASFGPQGKDQTCLACSINQGYDLLNTYSDESREKVIVLMTDGVPNYCPDDGCYGGTSTDYGSRVCEGFCDENGQSGCDSVISDGCSDLNCESAENSTYDAAVRAFDDLNVTFYTIGFGLVEDCDRASYLLSRIANISNGTFQSGSNVTAIRQIYENISAEILQVIEQTSQEIDVIEQGNLSGSILYSDSYIEVDYDPIAEQPAFDEIALAFEEPKFTSCNPSFTVPEPLRIGDAKITSYSGDHWTDQIAINDYEVYNLSSYFLNYVRMGDPFFVYVPVNKIQNGTNTLFIETADSPENKTGCSYNNTIIYTGFVKSSVSYAEVLPDTEGCLWTIDFEDGTSSSIPVPDDYSGAKTCSYTSTLIDYAVNDSIDAAAYQLFDNLDFDDDGEVFVNIDNLIVSAISVQRVPYPWGPAIAEVQVWK